MTDTEEKTTINTDSIVVVDEFPEVKIDDTVEIDKSIEKPKKPRTQKQIDAFNKCREVRRLKNEEKKKIKDANRKPLGRPKKVKIVEPVEEEEPSEDEISSSSGEEPPSPEVVYKKRPKRKKKKMKPPPKQKRIIYLTSSDEEEEEEDRNEEYEEPYNKFIEREERKVKNETRRRNLKYSDVIKFL